MQALFFQPLTVAHVDFVAVAVAVMRRIKALFDPQGLLNPGVILNDDAQSHLKNLKPMHAADALVDKCIECGYCEPVCPSRDLTLTPELWVGDFDSTTALTADVPAPGSIAT